VSHTTVRTGGLQLIRRADGCYFPSVIIGNRSSWLAVLLAALPIGAVVAWIRGNWVVVTVDGRSMVPTFADGDRVVVRRRTLADVRRGDVVVLEPPSDSPGPPAHERYWNVKRIGALPGDVVPPGVAGCAAGDRVPPGCLVVFGDNADSVDSRQRGFFRGDRLLGVVVRPLGGRQAGNAVPL
jgi:signal peptidase I